jgi:predicted small lipoprotein YifL
MMRSVAAILATALGLAGCGQKGPLYLLPTPIVPPAATPAPATPAQIPPAPVAPAADSATPTSPPKQQ